MVFLYQEDFVRMKKENIDVYRSEALINQEVNLPRDFIIEEPDAKRFHNLRNVNGYFIT